MTLVTETASSIIRNSILSSIYIDDRIVEPYDAAKADVPEYKISKGIYESFRKAQKSIDFYKYSNERNWEDDREYLFKNRDLLILDWDLAGNDAIHQPKTLEILERAVRTDSLHFISIYTGVGEKDFKEIIYLIKSFFNIQYSNSARKIIEDIIAELDEESIERKFFEDHRALFKEIAFSSGAGQKDVLDELKAKIQERLGKDLYPKFSKGIKGITGNINEGCELFGYAIHGIGPNEHEQDDLVINTDYTDANFIVVGHTVIQITSKKNPDPTELLNFFTEAVQKVCGNLLTLVTLEIRNLLRESSGFIGKGADDISDAVLFHQWTKKNSFFEFLMTIFKSHTVSHFDYKQGKLTSLHQDFWNAYRDEKNLGKEIAALDQAQNHPELVKELLKLNVYYNILHVRRGIEEKIKFGDVFVSSRNGQKDGGYFLCTTAHCDCLTPENIRNNFYFVRGESSNATDLVSKGDNVFCSYLPNDNGVIGIGWDPRPVVLKIQDSKIIDGRVDGVDGNDIPFVLEYVCTIKESYTQRMANNSFAHAMRVGIDFASLK